MNYDDLGSAQQIETRFQVRLTLWETHMTNPEAELEEALKRTEEKAGKARSPVASEAYSVLLSVSCRGKHI